MKKLFALLAVSSFLVTSCQKDEVIDDISIDESKTIQELPHYDDSNTELTDWKDFPDELKNAKLIKNDKLGSKVYSYPAGPYGGGGGRAFSFNPSTVHRIHAIAMSTGRAVDRLVVYYIRPNGTIYTGVDSGGSGGKYYIHFFSASEYIKNISGRSGSRLNRLTVFTNTKSFTHGSNDGNAFNVPIPPSGFQILGFFGKSGRVIDRLGFYIHTR